MKKTNKKVRTKQTWLVRRVASVVRHCMGEYDIHTECPLEEKCILLGTHSGISGPFVYNSYMPRYFAPWGTHEMLGNFPERWDYMYNTFYQTKCKLPKKKAFFKTLTLAPISRIFYSGVGLIGTYNDSRQMNAIKHSMNCLDANVPIMIFPENSSRGYFEKLTMCHSGFVILAKQYFARTGIDLPVYPSYLSKADKYVMVDTPIYVNKMLSEGMTREDIAEHVRCIINGLEDKYHNIKQGE